MVIASSSVIRIIILFFIVEVTLITFFVSITPTVAFYVRISR